jgi:hypothetical protein
MSSTYFGGSRSLAGSLAQKLVFSVVSGVARRGSSVRVGCASGADALVINAALSVAAPLAVFAVGSKAGAGFVKSSAVQSVKRAASYGASVTWLAGGPLSVPVRARLIKRSMAGVAGSAQAVFFLASASSSGSLAVAARAAGSGVPVVALCVGFSGPPAALKGQPGQWVRVRSGFFAQFRRAHAYKPVCVWQWQPAQQKLF